MREENRCQLNENESECLNNIISELKLSDVSIEICAGSKKGDNYIGQIQRVTVKGKSNESDQSGIYNFVLKSSNRLKEVRDVTPMEKCYQREIYMYETVLPTLEKFQDDKKIIDGFKNYPRYLGGSTEPMNEFLIMNDVKSDGFIMTDRKETLDFQHAEIIMRALGKYHALSFALKDQQPEVFKRYSDNTEEYFIKCFDEVDFRYQIKTICEKAVKSLDCVQDKDVVEKFEKFANEAFDVMVSTSTPTDDYAVISHGDCWSNNLLFKYEETFNERRPTAVCFVDWQESRYITPVCDISMFMYNCVGRNVLFENFDELINIYYESLSAFLKALGSDTEKIFPFQELENQIRKYFKYGIATACYQVNLMTANSEDIPDLETATEECGSALCILNLETSNQDMYYERMNAVIKHAAERGFI